MFTSEIKLSLLKVLKELGIEVEEGEIKLEHPDEMEHGDYSTNVALVVSKFQSSKVSKIQSCKEKNSETLKLCNYGTAKELAEQIKTKWQEMGLPEFVEKIEIAGSGFLNIWLSLDSIGKEIEGMLNPSASLRTSKSATTFYDPVIADFSPRKGDNSSRQKTIVIDYSAPNIAKPFGIGHLRSTNIGQTIYNLYKYLGWKTIGDNHLGDWGTQFGKLIYQIHSFKVSELQSMTVEDLEKLYVEFHKKAETDPAMEEEARMWFKKLEEGDPQAREIWQACVDISLKEFNRVYDLLGVKIDYTYGESFYQDKMQSVLDDCREKGILSDSEGAKVIQLEGFEIPSMLVKSDGATTYLLRDLATVKFRMAEFKPDLIVYEVGADQSFHFKQLFKICELLGYAKMNNFVHVAHGLIRWPTGKFSTRKGDTIHLEEVLREAIERAESIKGTKGIKCIKGEDVGVDPCVNSGDIAASVGIGAIKYNDLKQNPRTDIIFDWDQILTLQGNSGPYLQYCYARTQSVLNKFQSSRASELQNYGKEGFLNSETMKLCDFETEEIILLRTIYRFPEVVEEAAKEFSPNLLCNFLFNLAQKFNLFYDKHRILADSKQHIANGEQQAVDNRRLAISNISEDQSQFRLFLTASVGEVLKQGLTLLGIEVLEKM